MGPEGGIVTMADLVLCRLRWQSVVCGHGSTDRYDVWRSTLGDAWRSCGRCGHSTGARATLAARQAVTGVRGAVLAVRPVHDGAAAGAPGPDTGRRRLGGLEWLAHVCEPPRPGERGAGDRRSLTRQRRGSCPPGHSGDGL